MAFCIGNLWLPKFLKLMYRSFKEVLVLSYVRIYGELQEVDSDGGSLGGRSAWSWLDGFVWRASRKCIYRSRVDTIRSSRWIHTWLHFGKIRHSLAVLRWNFRQPASRRRWKRNETQLWKRMSANLSWLRQEKLWWKLCLLSTISSVTFHPLRFGEFTDFTRISFNKVTKFVEGEAFVKFEEINKRWCQHNKYVKTILHL